MHDFNFDSWYLIRMMQACKTSVFPWDEQEKGKIKQYVNSRYIRLNVLLTVKNLLSVCRLAPM